MIYTENDLRRAVADCLTVLAGQMQSEIDATYLRWTRDTGMEDLLRCAAELKPAIAMRSEIWKGVPSLDVVMKRVRAAYGNPKCIVAPDLEAAVQVLHTELLKLDARMDHLEQLAKRSGT